MQLLVFFVRALVGPHKDKNNMFKCNVNILGFIADACFLIARRMEAMTSFSKYNSYFASIVPNVS